MNMRQCFLDMAAPSAADTLSYFVRENAVFVILLFVVLLTIAVSVVNICVLKRNRRTHTEEKQQDDTDNSTRP